MDCPFCRLSGERVLLASVHSVAIDTRDEVLVGSAMIIPRAHRETPFDFTAEEWADTFDLLQKLRSLLDAEHAPDGYNVGWNVGAVAGQEVFHAHLHVIPRYQTEPLAGRGIRYSLKQPTNRRPAG